MLHCAIKYAPLSEYRARLAVLGLIGFCADLGIKDADGRTCFDLLKERCKDDSRMKCVREEYKKILIKITPSTAICSDALKTLRKITQEDKEAATVFLNEVYNLKDITLVKVNLFRTIIKKQTRYAVDADKASIGIDKDFLTKAYENAREKTSKTGRAFLDPVY